MSALAPIPVQQSPIDERTSRIDGNWLRWLNALKDRAEQSAASGGDITAAQIVSGIIALARIAGLTNAQIAAGAAIAWSKVSKAGSSLADLETRSASDLTLGTLPDAQFPATLPAISGANLTNLDASDLASGTVPDARFPATLPAASGENLTALNATNIASGTLADARLSAKVPLDDVAEAISGVWDFSNGLKERGRAAKIGEWTAVAFDAANFTASGAMTWTVAVGDQFVYKYMLVGKTMILAYEIRTSTVGGVLSSALQIAIPGGFLSAGRTWSFHRLSDAGAVATFGTAFVGTGGAVVQLFVDNTTTTNWAASADLTSVAGTIAFEVQ